MIERREGSLGSQMSLNPLTDQRSLLCPSCRQPLPVGAENGSEPSVLARVGLTLALVLLGSMLWLPAFYFWVRVFALIGERPFWLLMGVFCFACVLHYAGGVFFWGAVDLWRGGRAESPRQ